MAVKRDSLQRHKFDTKAKVAIFFGLMVFAIALELLHSGSGRDVIMLIAGVFVGKGATWLRFDG